MIMFYKINKTGQQHVSRPVEQSFGFIRKVQKRGKQYIELFIFPLGVNQHLGVNQL